MPSRLHTFVLVMTLSGCGLFGDDSSDIEIRTDANRYTSSPETVVELSVANKSDAPIFYICTGQIYLEELDGGRVNKRWMIHGFEECLGPGPIDSGEKETFELGFDEKSALGNVQGAAFDEDTRYRMSVDLFWDRSFNRALSDEERSSNTFRIVRNPVQ